MIIMNKYCQKHWYSGTRMPRRIIRLSKYKRLEELQKSVSTESNHSQGESK
jgi:hypothetical protein